MKGKSVLNETNMVLLLDYLVFLNKLQTNLTQVNTYSIEKLPEKIKNFCERYPLYLLVFYPYTDDFENVVIYDEVIHNVILSQVMEMQNIMTVLETENKHIGLSRFCDEYNSHSKLCLFEIEEFLTFCENPFTGMADANVDVYVMDKTLIDIKEDTSAQDKIADKDLTRKEFANILKVLIKNLHPKTDMNIEKMTKLLEDQFVEFSENKDKKEALKIYLRLCKLISKGKLKLPAGVNSIELMKVEKLQDGKKHYSFNKVYVSAVEFMSLGKKAGNNIQTLNSCWIKIPKGNKSLLGRIVQKIRFSENRNCQKMLENNDVNVESFAFHSLTSYYMDIISPELIFLRAPSTLISQIYTNYIDFGLQVFFDESKKEETVLNKPLLTHCKNSLMASVEDSSKFTTIVDKKQSETEFMAVDTNDAFAKQYSKVVTITPDDEHYRYNGELTIGQLTDKYSCAYAKLGETTNVNVCLYNFYVPIKESLLNTTAGTLNWSILCIKGWNYKQKKGKPVLYKITPKVIKMKDFISISYKTKISGPNFICVKKSSTTSIYHNIVGCINVFPGVLSIPHSYSLNQNSKHIELSDLCLKEEIQQDKKILKNQTSKTGYIYDEKYNIVNTVSNTSNDPFDCWEVNKIIRVVSKFLFFDASKNPITSLVSEEFIKDLKAHLFINGNAVPFSFEIKNNLSIFRKTNIFAITTIFDMSKALAKLPEEFYQPIYEFQLYYKESLIDIRNLKLSHGNLELMMDKYQADMDPMREKIFVINKNYIERDIRIKLYNSCKLIKGNLLINWSKSSAKDLKANTKEFFLQAAKEIMSNMERGYFNYNIKGNLILSPKACEKDPDGDLFYTLGFLSAKCINYDQYFGVCFSQPINKFLLGYQLEQSDLELLMNEIDYADFKEDVKEILENDNKEREYFVRETICHGKVVKNELAAGGSEIPVDKENFEIWVERLIQYYLYGQNYHNKLLLDRFKEAFIKYTNYEDLKTYISSNNLRVLFAGCGQNSMMAMCIDKRLNIVGFRALHNSNLFRKELYKLSVRALRGLMKTFCGTHSMDIFNEEWELQVRFVEKTENAINCFIHPDGYGADLTDCNDAPEMKMIITALSTNKKEKPES